MLHAPALHDAGVSLAINLLGAPSVTVGGASQPAPRGKKAWALLAYVLLSGRANPREQLRQCPSARIVAHLG